MQERTLPFAADVKYEQRTLPEDEIDEDVPVLDQQNLVEFRLPKNTPITATRSGKVIESLESLADCGDLIKAHETNRVIVDEGQGIRSVYIHLKPTISKGTEIYQGQELGQLHGYCSKPHLHYLVVKMEEDDTQRALPVEFAEPPK